MRRRRTRRSVESVEPTGALVPVPSLPTIDPTKRGGTPLGRMLETARKRVFMSEASAADRLHISQRELIDFESGMRTPSRDLLAEMCETYGTSIDRMVSDVGVALDDADDPTVLWIGWAPIELDDAPNRERILRIATTLREVRHVAETAPVVVREEELMAICRSIDVDHPDLLDDLADAFLLGHERTAELFARMRYKVATIKELPGRQAELGPG